MSRPVLLLLVFVLAASAAGCGGSEPVRQDPFALSERMLFESLDRLTAPAADSARAVRRARYAADRMRRAGLMPVFASSFFVPFETAGAGAHPGRSHVLGYVPGRDPNHHESLVVVAADLNSPAAAAVLETARRLALEALDTQVPERTLLFALWGPPRTGAQGVADYVAKPTWGRERIEHVLLVTADTAEAARSESLLGRSGITAEVIGAPAIVDGELEEVLRAETRALAEVVYARTRGLSLADDAAPSDSLAATIPTR